MKSPLQSPIDIVHLSPIAILNIAVQVEFSWLSDRSAGTNSWMTGAMPRADSGRICLLSSDLICNSELLIVGKVPP